MRIGIGYDVHPFDPNRALVIGGVRIEGTWGLRGHSDADVLLHAIGDACLGAAALGDLGEHFPDSDPTWRGAPSAVLLSRILELVRAKGLSPGNVDATVVAERPRLAPFRQAMRERWIRPAILALAWLSRSEASHLANLRSSTISNMW